MQLSYDDVFKYSEIFNPISLRTLFLAGKLAELDSNKTIIDLGSGKGFPSLLWASVFGVKIEGYDLNNKYVKYANTRARLLNLSDRVRYRCGDVRDQRSNKEYDVVSALGLGVVEIYGALDTALKIFRKLLGNSGILIFGEPIWLVEPVPQNIQEILESPEKNFSTKHEIERLFEEHDFDLLGSFVSSKEDWECYIRPVNVAMLELMKSQPELETECRKIMDGFEAEYQVANKYWDMILWVAKTHS